MGKSSKVKAVVGGQWGDEGKGKIIDYFAQDADLVIRAQGGDNAGHTVINKKGTFKLNLIPSGIFNPKTKNIISQGTVVNPNTLIREINDLNLRGVKTNNLYLSENAHLILDFHIYLDKMQEEKLGKAKIGTTVRGIGPAYTSKVKRVGLRAHLIKNPRRFRIELANVLNIESQIFKKAPLPEEFKPGYYEKYIRLWSKMLDELITDTNTIIWQALEKGSKILIEGAQGALIDLDFGTYPYVTSSNPTINGLLLGSGIPANNLTESFGVFKAYQTRVGSGGMPTELKDTVGDQIRQKAGEFGTTTGRPRRIGWFDGVAAAYSHKVNGFTNIALTRLDILSGMGEVRICSEYRFDRKRMRDFPSDDMVLKKCEPMYQSFKGWKEDLSKIRKFDNLPREAQRYCKAIEALFPGAKLSLIGVGPEREALIKI